MKKLLLSVAAVMAFATASAQEVKFGVKAGLNMSSIQGGYYSGAIKPGFHIGGLAEIKLNDKFAIQPELLYSLKGSDYNAGLGLFGINLGLDKINLSYVDLPIIVKYFPIEHLSVEAGPNVSFLTSAKSVGSSSVDVKDNYNTVDYGMNIGAGYELKQGILFQLRYNLGLSDISKTATGATKYSEKNTGFQVSVGYKF
jgi:hypothetical protein